MGYEKYLGATTGAHPALAYKDDQRAADVDERWCKKGVFKNHC